MFLELSEWLRQHPGKVGHDTGFFGDDECFSHGGSKGWLGGSPEGLGLENAGWQADKLPALSPEDAFPPPALSPMNKDQVFGKVEDQEILNFRPVGAAGHGAGCVQSISVLQFSDET
ncbi:hypothetical protein OVA24_14355 [Luteolibacter sp. SL250]|uniref:hypothetical protein n=1 Tax=Luteolibacter sp. SL250 TaxID=2995170 RepID=UPI00226F3B0E|nr:hypothetical protein [Luteolibacter sp. SL250]WAC18413.1 hypothetical protein OVA24_14355 [Luteolibacter sp. SL250]